MSEGEPINVDLGALPESERLSLQAMLDQEWKEKGYVWINTALDVLAGMRALADRVRDGSIGEVVPATDGQGWTVRRGRKNIGRTFETYDAAELAMIEWKD